MQFSPAPGNLRQNCVSCWGSTYILGLQITWGRVGIALFHFLGGGGGEMNQDPDEERKRPLAVSLPQTLNCSGAKDPSSDETPSLSYYVPAQSLHWASVLLISPHPSGNRNQLVWEGVVGWQIVVLVSEGVKCGGWEQAPLWILGAESWRQPWLSLTRTISNFILKGFGGRQWAASLQSFPN